MKNNLPKQDKELAPVSLFSDSILLSLSILSTVICVAFIFLLVNQDANVDAIITFFNLILSAVSIISIVLFRNYAVPKRLMIIAGLLGFSFAVYTGGVAGSSLVWVGLFPILVNFVVARKEGLFWSGLFLFNMLIILILGLLGYGSYFQSIVFIQIFASIIISEIFGYIIARNFANKEAKLHDETKIAEQSQSDLQMQMKEEEEINKGLKEAEAENRKTRDAIMNVVEDIEKEKATVQTLEKRLAIATKSAKIGIIDWDIQKDKLLVDAIMLEITHKMNVNELQRIDQLKELIIPEDKKHFEESLNTSIAKRAPFAVEYRILTHDNILCFIETHGQIIYNDAEEAVRLVGASLDVTEKKLSEKRIEQEGIKYKTLANRFEFAMISAGIGVWEWDVVKNHLTWDDMMYKLYGIRKDAFNGAYEAWRNGLHPEDRDAGDKAIQDALKNKKEFNTKFRVVWPDKSVHYIHAFGLVERSRAGKPLRMTGVNWDITQETLVDKAKSEFVSLASHQLRTPLTTVNWYSEMLLSGDAGKLTKAQMEFTREIHFSNKRLIGLVNALLNASRIDLGTLAIDPGPVNIVDMCKDVIRDLQKQIVEKKIRVTESYKKNIPIIQADQNLTRIIFENLLSNAVKYTPKNGKVFVNIAATKKNFIEIVVQDTGMGIPKSQQGEIFKKLFRAENAQKSNIEGTGLGLYVVKAIVQESKGKIWMESEENKGTTFHVELPVSGIQAKRGSKGLISELTQESPKKS